MLLNIYWAVGKELLYLRYYVLSTHAHVYMSILLSIKIRRVRMEQKFAIYYAIFTLKARILPRLIKILWCLRSRSVIRRNPSKMILPLSLWKFPSERRSLYLSINYRKGWWNFGRHVEMSAINNEQELRLAIEKNRPEQVDRNTVIVFHYEDTKPRTT